MTEKTTTNAAKNESECSVIHSTFAIERTYAASAEKVFAAFADPEKKRRWFASETGKPGAAITSDFRVGGYERSRFVFSGAPGGPPGAPPAGTSMGNDTTYLDIVPNRRIVFAYVMLVGEKRMSASLATVALDPVPGGTRLTYTEQAAFFERGDGPKLRREGWDALLGKLGDAL